MAYLCEMILVPLPLRKISYKFYYSTAAVVFSFSPIFIPFVVPICRLFVGNDDAMIASGLLSVVAKSASSLHFANPSECRRKGKSHVYLYKAITSSHFGPFSFFLASSSH